MFFISYWIVYLLSVDDKLMAKQHAASSQIQFDPAKYLDQNVISGVSRSYGNRPFDLETSHTDTISSFQGSRRLSKSHGEFLSTPKTIRQNDPVAQKAYASSTKSDDSKRGSLTQASQPNSKTEVSSSSSTQFRDTGLPLSTARLRPIRQRTRNAVVSETIP